MTGVDAERLDIELTGGSQLTARGTADAVAVLASGGSRANLFELEVAAASVDLTGGGRAELTATERVTGQASGGSAVEVRGAAAVDVEASGGSSVSTP